MFLMPYKNISYNKDQNKAIIKLNRPEALNALNQETLSELGSALDEIRNDPEVKVVLITAEGQKAFSAGADLKEASSLDEAGVKELIELGQGVYRKIDDLPKPVLVAVNGIALGGGVEMSLAGDVRVASETAKLGSPEVNIGLIPGWGGTQRLPKILGKGKAAELILTGGVIDAKEAERVGLVDRVLSQDEFTSTVNRMASAIAAKPSTDRAELIQLIKSV